MTKIATLFFTFIICSNLIGQEKSHPKTQPTNFLSKSYYSINFGGIFYPFSNQNLIDGTSYNKGDGMSTDWPSYPYRGQAEMHIMDEDINNIYTLNFTQTSNSTIYRAIGLFTTINKTNYFSEKSVFFPDGGGPNFMNRRSSLTAVD